MYVKAPIPSEVYHLTKKANLESILDDGAIRRFDDTECWFCESLAKMKAYTFGASLKEIAEQMSKTGPAYDEGKSWNKNMIARILENPKCTGADSHPKLVDIKLFE